MVSRQVITFSPDGSVSGLQRKPGQGIDLRQFGKAEIKRASEIVWDTDVQAWYIDVLQEAGQGVVTHDNIRAASREAFYTYVYSQGRDGLFLTPSRDALFFSNYDDAVKVEIAYLDALRLKGIH